MAEPILPAPPVISTASFISKSPENFKSVIPL